MMTCREKLKNEYPNRVNDVWIGGCQCCPDYYGYLDNPECCDGVKDISDSDMNCRACWDREIPEQNLSNVEYLTKDEHISECHPTIKDSGARREFETGAVRDIQEGKGRCDLLPLDVIGEFSEDPIFLCISDFITYGHISSLYSVLRESPARLEFGSYPSMWLEVSKHFEEGAKKYGEYNWQKGIPTHCYIDSAVRHYLKYLRGDTDERHDRAFVWNILCCIWTCKHKPELIESLPYSELITGKDA